MELLCHVITRNRCCDSLDYDETMSNRQWLSSWLMIVKEELLFKMDFNVDYRLQIFNEKCDDNQDIKRADYINARYNLL